MDSRQQLLDEISARLEPYKDVLVGTEPEFPRRVPGTSYIDYGDGSYDYDVEFRDIPIPSEVTAFYRRSEEMRKAMIMNAIRIPPDMLVFDKRKISLEP